MRNHLQLLLLLPGCRNSLVLCSRHFLLLLLLLQRACSVNSSAASR
jgi:hypothetical protein